MAFVVGGKRRPGGTTPTVPLNPLEQSIADRVARALRDTARGMEPELVASVVSNLDPDQLTELLYRIDLSRLQGPLEDAYRGLIVSGGEQETRRILAQSPASTPIVTQAGITLPSGIVLPPGLAPVDVIGYTLTPTDRAMFRHIDPRAVDYARRRAGRLIVELTDSTRLAVRRQITQHIVAGSTPYRIGVDVRQTVGLHSRWADAVTNYRARTVAQLTRGGMGTDAAVARADVMAKRYRDRLIRRRGEMIARTEVQFAQNTARQTAWDAGVAEGFIDRASQKVWRVTPAGDPCSVCLELNGQRVQWNAAFPTGVLTPPQHPHCRCGVVLVPPSRGLTGLPSQDINPWLAELDAMEAEYLAGVS